MFPAKATPVSSLPRGLSPLGTLCSSRGRPGKEEVVTDEDQEKVGGADILA